MRCEPGAIHVLEERAQHLLRPAEAFGPGGSDEHGQGALAGGTVVVGSRVSRLERSRSSTSRTNARVDLAPLPIGVEQRARDRMWAARA